MTSSFFNCCHLCASLEIRDANESVLYRIEIPCRLCALPAHEAEFVVAEVTGEQVSPPALLIKQRLLSKEVIVLCLAIYSF